jgi:hypothetical protein
LLKDTFVAWKVDNLVRGTSSMVRRLHLPLLKPEDVIPHLAKQELHWKAGYSAMELAVAWFAARTDFPTSVRAVLNTAEEYVQAELVDGFFEREVELGSRGRNSQTDLMVIAGLAGELGVIAVEGKVEEAFADNVTDWNNTPGKRRRLDILCRTLAVNAEQIGGIRYQLLHRTASAINEAKRYRCRHALMLVHSFSRTHRWFDDFAAFAHVVGVPVNQPNVCSAAKDCGGVSLRLAWVADAPHTR